MSVLRHGIRMFLLLLLVADGCWSNWYLHSTGQLGLTSSLSYSQRGAADWFTANGAQSATGPGVAASPKRGDPGTLHS